MSSERAANRPENEPLEKMITTLRREQAPTWQKLRYNTPFKVAGGATSESKDDNEECMQCTHHTHTNANCFIQHLEKRGSGTREGSRAPSGKKDSKEKKNNKKDRKWKKGKDKRAAAAVHSEKDTDSDADLSDSDDDDSGGVSATAIAAMSSKNMNSRWK